MSRPASAAVAPATVKDLRDLFDLLERAEGFAALQESLRAGKSGTIDGAWGSSAALAVATLARHVPQTLLVVLAHPSDVDGWLADLASFSGVAPVILPAWDSWPPTLDETSGQRLRLLRRLESAQPPTL